MVESIPLACTHFDAIRFFAPAAVPLNTVEPTPSRATQPELEQPGCVHATMDLFRYSLKLWPFLPAELLVCAILSSHVVWNAIMPWCLALQADSLELALKARVLDVRASPYDLSLWHGREFDLSPIKVETSEGRREYQREQSKLAARAVPIRRRLIEQYELVIAFWAHESHVELKMRTEPEHRG